MPPYDSLNLKIFSLHNVRPDVNTKLSSQKCDPYSKEQIIFSSDNNNNKKASTAFKETFKEISPYTQQKAGTYNPYQANYYQSYNTPTTPQTSSNVPATYSYQTGSNTEQSNTANSYYGNYGYMPSKTREQSGYQRSQGYKKPTQPNIPGYTKPWSTASPYVSRSPTSVPKLSTYSSSSSLYGTPKPTFIPKSPTPTSSYVPKSPSYTQGLYRAGIPATSYRDRANTFTYPTTPETYDRVSEGNRGYPKSYTANTPVAPPYNPQWSGSRRYQMGYTRKQIPLPSANQRGPTNNPQYQQNTGGYNGYLARRYQQPSRYYYPENTGAGNRMAQAGTGAASISSDVMQTGSTLQGSGYARNGIYSPSSSNSAFNTMPSQAVTTNSASQGNRYSSIPQTATNSQYSTSQYAGNIPTTQYQSMVPTSGQQSGQYGPLTNQYSTEFKSSIPQNPSWGNDVTRQATSAYDVRSMSYTNDLQSPTQNAYPRNSVYVNDFKNYWGNNGYGPTFYTKGNNLNLAGSPSQQYTSSYATQSMTPEYGSNYPYPAGSEMTARGNIARFNSAKMKQKLRTAYQTNQNKAQRQQNLRTIQGLIHGPYQNKNKPSSKVNKLDENGQFPSDMKRYKTLAQLNARKDTVQALGAGVGSSTYMGAKQPVNARYDNRWSARNFDRDAKTGSYDSWSAGMQAQKPENLWNSGPVAKVDEAVKYDNDVTTLTSQPTGTNAENKAATKNIDMDNVVNNALTDFLTTHILRKRKRRKRENELT